MAKWMFIQTFLQMKKQWLQLGFFRWYTFCFFIRRLNFTRENATFWRVSDCIAPDSSWIVAEFFNVISFFADFFKRCNGVFYAKDFLDMKSCISFKSERFSISFRSGKLWWYIQIFSQGLGFMNVWTSNVGSFRKVYVFCYFLRVTKWIASGLLLDWVVEKLYIMSPVFAQVFDMKNRNSPFSMVSKWCLPAVTENQL